MSSPLTAVQRRIRTAGILIIAGLVVELITLHWSHPTAFLFFLFFGGTLMAAGIVVYLLSLLSHEKKAQSE